MPRRLFLTVSLLAVILTACASSATPVPAASASPAPIYTATNIPHADSIRFALLGDVALTNVWAYYDERGADYNNRAVQAGMWPSLYALSPLTQMPELLLAEAPFSPVETLPGTSLLTSAVAIRPGLLWSDGTSLTAADVAFTVNTALAFRLGLDWGAAYDYTNLDHAEAADARTVLFYFKYQPAILNWQYGALQGPIVNATFWEPKVAAAKAMLQPVAGLEEETLNLRIEGVRLKNEMNELLYQLSLLGVDSRAAEDKRAEINRKQEEINAVEARIEEKQDQVESVFTAARETLYALDASGEPTFGPFVPGARREGEFVNDINPAYPFAQPNFDHAVYRVYADEQAAAAALQNGEVNVILKSNGVTDPEERPWPAMGGSTPNLPRNRRSDMRYLAFNLADPFLADIYLRQAIACVAAQHSFPTTVYYLDGFVLPENSYWYDANIRLPCAGLDAQARGTEAVRLLESAGYAWEARPAWDGAPVPGSGLRRAGRELPPMTILVADDDPLRIASASAIAEQLKFLGLDASVERAAPADVLYRVFETHQYDMVVLGWRLARYPGYLCDLFGSGNPYAYANADLEQHCAFFRAATDLELARQEVFAIQSILAANLPAVPLYSESVFDAMRGVTYPFDATLDGVTGLYGAPWLAIPAP